MTFYICLYIYICVFVCVNTVCLCVFFCSWRIGASEALRHPWLSDTVLHHRLHEKVQGTHSLLIDRIGWDHSSYVATILWSGVVLLIGLLSFRSFFKLLLTHLCVLQKNMCNRSRRSSCVPTTDSWGKSLTLPYQTSHIFSTMTQSYCIFEHLCKYLI
jgi:hypothetical protein